MTPAVQASPVGLAPPYELGPSSLRPGEASSSIPRSLSRGLLSKSVLEITQTLANHPSTSGPQTYGIIVSIASGDLLGVIGDLPLVFDELRARTTGALRVLADFKFESPNLGPMDPVLLPTSQSIKRAIKEVGQVLAKGDLCYVYLAGHTAVNPEDNSVLMPLPSGEYLNGNDLAGWLQDAASGGGTIIGIVDVCDSSAFLKMPIPYGLDDVDALVLSEDERPGQGGQVIILSATEFGQLARTNDVKDGKYAGRHGFFTWVLFNYIRELPLKVNTKDLLYHLRKECARHPEKPCPQLSATIEGLRQLPLGRLSA